MVISPGEVRRPIMVATQRLRSIAPPFSKKNRLTTLGKRGERFARLVGLQTLAEQRAFPADLSGDLVHLAHQRFGLAQRAGRPFGKSLGGLSSPGAQTAGTTASLAKPQA